MGFAEHFGQCALLYRFRGATVFDIHNVTEGHKQRTDNFFLQIYYSRFSVLKKFKEQSTVISLTLVAVLIIMIKTSLEPPRCFGD